MDIKAGLVVIMPEDVPNGQGVDAPGSLVLNPDLEDLNQLMHDQLHCQ